MILKIMLELMLVICESFSLTTLHTILLLETLLFYLYAKTLQSISYLFSYLSSGVETIYLKSAESDIDFNEMLKLTPWDFGRY